MKARTAVPAREPPGSTGRGRGAHRVAGALLLAGAAAALAGCGVQRVLVVDSTPAGARLFVNGQDVGTTPHRVTYVHEGRFDVRLEMPGYESVADEIVTRSGPDATPGPDFFLENLSGGRALRTTERHYDLVPLKRESYTKEEMEAVLRKAVRFRDRAGRELDEPGTPAVTRPHETAAPGQGASAPGR